MPEVFRPPTTVTTPSYQPTEIIRTDSRVVACDGGVGTLGHPRVWLRIQGQQTLCPYCSRLFVLNPGAGHDTGH